MRVLLIGNGQIGREVYELLKENDFEVDQVKKTNWNMGVNPKLGRKIVMEKRPDLLINTAALTNVDYAELNEQEAFNINSIAPKNLALGCEAIGIPMIHISSDYVYSGRKKTPYLESDKCSPINIYGKSKLEGDTGIISSTKKFIIIRTSWVFSNSDNNFLTNILNFAKQNKDLKIVGDQIGGPTSARCVARCIYKFACMISHKTVRWGIYNFSGEPHVSWFQFTKKIFYLASIYNLSLKTPELSEIKSTEFKRTAKRPLDSRLSNEKLIKEFEINPCNWEEELDRYIKSLIPCN